MLKWNFQRIYELRMIQKPYTFLIQNGFTQSKALRLAKSDVNKLSLEDIEKLCRILYVSPDEILEWREDNKSTVPADHPLRKFQRKEINMNLVGKLKNMPIDKVAEAYNIISGM